jgi:hypothetical protein
MMVIKPVLILPEHIENKVGERLSILNYNNKFSGLIATSKPYIKN